MNTKQIAIILLSTLLSITSSNHAQETLEKSNQDFLQKTALECTPTYCALCQRINANPQNYTTAQQEACNTLKNATINSILLEFKAMKVPFNQSIVEAVYQASNELYPLVPENELSALLKETTDTDEQLKNMLMHS